MKQTFLVILAILSFSYSVQAQRSAVDALISSGNKVFIEVNDINKNTDGACDSFKKHLQSSEWNRWELVDEKSDANFVCRLNVEKLGFNIMSARSYGARVRVTTEVLTIDGVSVWKSKKQQGNVSEFTKFDALSDAMRKVIRRSLPKELYNEK